MKTKKETMKDEDKILSDSVEIRRKTMRGERDSMSACQSDLIQISEIPISQACVRAGQIA